MPLFVYILSSLGIVLALLGLFFVRPFVSLAGMILALCGFTLAFIYLFASVGGFK